MLKDFIVVLGSSLYQRDSLTPAAWILGTLYLIAIIVFVWMYFQRKMYEKTYLPIMMLIYVFVNMAIFVYARVGRFGIGGMLASRYILDTKLAAFSMFMIITRLFCDGKRESTKIMSFAIAFCLSICLVLCVTNLLEFRTAKWRKAYHQRAVDTLMNIDHLEDHELHINQASDAGVFRKAAALMKKYE